MTSNLAEGLLGRLNRGETAAAADLYTAYGAYLRAVVRRQLSARLRAQFDSADVVQSVWVQIVRKIATSGCHVENEDQLRALLAVVTRRRLCTKARSPIASSVGTSLSQSELERLPSTNQPRPSEFVQADEMWETLLRLCPPEHRAVLYLRREGLTPPQIAARTGLHEGSIRRILRNLARDLVLETQSSPAFAEATS